MTLEEERFQYLPQKLAAPAGSGAHRRLRNAQMPGDLLVRISQKDLHFQQAAGSAAGGGLSRRLRHDPGRGHGVQPGGADGDGALGGGAVWE